MAMRDHRYPGGGPRSRELSTADRTVASPPLGESRPAILCQFLPAIHAAVGHNLDHQPTCVSSCLPPAVFATVEPVPAIFTAAVGQVPAIVAAVERVPAVFATVG